MSSTRSEWPHATKHHRCPVCGKPDWCLIAPDGTAVICPRTPSDKRVGDAGWLHKLEGQTAVVAKCGIHVRHRPPPKSQAEIVNLMRHYRTAVNAQRLERLAERLGVTLLSLDRLGIGWAGERFCGKCQARRGAWAFPMVEADGGTLGIRVRFEVCNHKSAITGGHEGLFVPAGQSPMGETSRPSAPVLFCEGPTSAAALLDMGFDVIGRPSCLGGVGLVCELLGTGPRRDVVVLGDRDDPKHRPDGSTWRPGQDGARRLAQDILPLCRSVKVVVPPFVKDARDWKREGATRAVVEAVIRAANYVRKDQRP